jgi:hypothetical protein
MSYCEDYVNPFDRDPNDDEGEIEREDDEDNWICLYPDKCLMPALHTRDECHTVEDAEAYYAETFAEDQPQ